MVGVDYWKFVDLGNMVVLSDGRKNFINVL